MKYFVYALVAALAATSAASALSLNAPSEEAAFRAAAQANARMDLSEATMTDIVSVLPGEAVVFVDGALSVVPAADRANAASCVNSNANALRFANNVNPVSLSAANQCSYQAIAGSIPAMTVASSAGGSADAWNYGFPFGYHFVFCGAAGVSGVMNCAGFGFGAPLSAFSVWDGYVINGLGQTAAYYG